MNLTHKIELPIRNRKGEVIACAHTEGPFGLIEEAAEAASAIRHKLDFLRGAETV